MGPVKTNALPDDKKTLLVLNNGYVRLVDVMGTDLSVVNAARVSFQKEAKWEYDTQNIKEDEVGSYAPARLAPRDKKLLQFLAREGHTSPFRHAFLCFEIKAPLMVARQWWKYVVGSDHTLEAWNEASRRYVTMEPEFYEPDVWRGAPENKKQGSFGVLESKDQAYFSEKLKEIILTGTALYEQALEKGMAPEQARLFIPAYALQTVWRWSCSLQAFAHFLDQRLADDAQKEIQLYAYACEQLALRNFPESLNALKTSS
jgi:thymidylate synthase (FAD)